MRNRAVTQQRREALSIIFSLKQALLFLPKEVVAPHPPRMGLLLMVAIAVINVVIE